jgi:hypothetical protein
MCVCRNERVGLFGRSSWSVRMRRRWRLRRTWRPLRDESASYRSVVSVVLSWARSVCRLPSSVSGTTATRPHHHMSRHNRAASLLSPGSTPHQLLALAQLAPCTTLYTHRSVIACVCKRGVRVGVWRLLVVRSLASRVMVPNSAVLLTMLACLLACLLVINCPVRRNEVHDEFTQRYPPFASSLSEAESRRNDVLQKKRAAASRLGQERLQAAQVQ